VSQLLLSRTGKILATQTVLPGVGLANKLTLWDPLTGRRLREVGFPWDPLLPAVFSLLRHDVREGFGSNVVEELLGALEEVAIACQIISFQFSRDERLLLTAHLDGKLRIWDVATGKKLRTCETADRILTLDIAPDGKTVASLGDSNKIRLWDLATGKELHE